MNELTEEYYIAGQNTLADAESQPYIRAVQYAVLNFFVDLSDRSTAETMDEYISTIESNLLDSSSLLSFSPKTLRNYLYPFFNSPMMRELILHTWQNVVTVVNHNQIKTVHARLCTSATMLINGNKTLSDWMDSEVIEMMRGDYPQQSEVETALSELPWLFIPLMIANYCDFYMIEQIVAKRMNERVMTGNNNRRPKQNQS